MTSMAKASTTSDQTRMGMMFAETDDELAYLVFVAPDYPERVAKQLVDKHARAVESMASDGARTRATCHTLPARATPSRPRPEKAALLHAHRLPHATPRPSSRLILTLAFHRHIRQRARRKPERAREEGVCSGVQDAGVGVRIPPAHACRPTAAAASRDGGRSQHHRCSCQPQQPARAQAQSMRSLRAAGLAAGTRGVTRCRR